jgi:hypothetical protein
MGQWNLGKDSSFSYNEDDGTLTISWNTGGHENVVCGLKFKVELVDKIKSTYIAPKIKYDPDYDKPF